MAAGMKASLADRVLAQGETVIGSATKRLQTTHLGLCASRVWLGAPISHHTRGSANTGYVLVGDGSVLITLTGLPTAGQTVVINDGRNSAVTFTWGTDVTIGSDATACAVNLVAAINAEEDLDSKATIKSAGVVRVRYVQEATETSSNLTIGAINATGSTPLETTDTAGYWEPVEDPSLIFVTAFNANDAVEWRIIG